MVTADSRFRVLGVALAIVSLLLVGLATVIVPARAADDGITAGGSARQVYAVGLPRGAAADLLDSAGDVVARRDATSLGGVLFRKVKPGSGYRVRVDGTGETSEPVTVHGNGAAQWNDSIYDQTMPSDGYGYLTMRDGTQLAYSVHPPTSPAGIGGAPIPVPAGVVHPPYPTLIEYSGYGYADPDGPTAASRRSPT